MKIRRRYFLIFFGVIILGLIIFRIYLPTLVKNYVNKVLADLPGYYGEVEDIDIALYRGAYTIKGLYLNKVEANSQIPFLDFPHTDISIEWGALLKGRIVSEIVQKNPKLNYILEDQNEDSGASASAGDWTDALDNLVPISINRYTMKNGKIAFKQLSANPDIDLSIKKLALTLTNLQSVEKSKKKLPTSIKGSGVSIGGGKLQITGKANVLKTIPDLNIDLKLEKVNLEALNDAADHYAGITFSGGVLNFYNETSITDGYLKGYVKPLFHKTKLISKDDTFFEKIWEGLVTAIEFILRNKKTGNFGTIAPIEGKISDIDANIWKTLMGIFKNGWIKALSSDIEKKKGFADFQKEKEKEDKEKEKKSKKEDKEKKSKEDEKEKKSKKGNKKKSKADSSTLKLKNKISFP